MAKRKVSLLVVAFLCLFFVAYVLAGEFHTAFYEMVTYGKGMKIISKNFIKGNKMRMETDAEGILTVVIYDGEKFYSYVPQQNIAMILPSYQIQKQMYNPGDFKGETKYIGDEVVEGKLCEVRQGPTGSGDIYKVWLAKDTGFPVKAEFGEAVTLFRDVKLNISVDDKLFILPAGVQILDVSQKSQGITSGMPQLGSWMEDMDISSSNIDKIKEQMEEMRRQYKKE